MQLVATGAQDIYLTGNPQITFFKVVYRRYTNFSVETIEQQVIGDPGFGKRINIKVQKSGDLVNKMYIRVLVESVNPGLSSFAWIRRLGHAIIKEVTAELGGHVIDRHYGTWLDIWWELSGKTDQKSGYSVMIGDVPQMTSYNNLIKPRYYLYIPLQFWFNRFIGNSIPLIALQYHELNINIWFENKELLVIADQFFDINQVRMLDATLVTDYIFLDSDERKRFAQMGHEYLIEQVQWNGPEQVLNACDQRYRLDFNHPVKEIIWAMKNGNYTTGKPFLYYSGNNIWSMEDAAINLLNHSISIEIDPTCIVGGIWSEVPKNSFTTIQNLNIINDSNESVFINANSLIFNGISITGKINADILIDKDKQIIYDGIQTSINIQDLSIPTCLMEDTRIDPRDPLVYQFNNYGQLIDGSINPIASGVIQFNGLDRFQRRDGAYFNYVQPDQHHSNIPQDGICVYSFSLFPEEHQPSGTANFSRINRSDLVLTFDGSCIVNFFNDANQLFIYATNYNVLRIMSGLSGLCYIK